jgi:simple sugar transport system substrate-binding protein
MIVRRASWLVALLVVAVLAGCGQSTEVREPDLVVRGGGMVPAQRQAADPDARGLRIASARIVFITHGQASDPFWAVVKKGIDDAERQTGTSVSYRAPDRFSLPRMRRLIDEAIVDHPDGMVISIPDAAAIGPSIRAAVKADIPVITINSGSDVFKQFGVLAHIGQPEFDAGVQAGVRFGQAGVEHALCVNQESGNKGLDERCRGFAAGLARSGGDARAISVPLQDPARAQRRMAQAIQGNIDGVLTLGPGIAGPAMAAVGASGKSAETVLATFDLSPEVLEAVRDRKMLFAVDQQPYLQGYLPVVLLAEESRHKVFPGHGELIPTGPHFVTHENAAEVLRLAQQGVR